MKRQKEEIEEKKKRKKKEAMRPLASFIQPKKQEKGEEKGGVQRRQPMNIAVSGERRGIWKRKKGGKKKSMGSLLRKRVNS